ncbi:hypothetical protein C8R43DRAFT_1149130 [Mycena crocata]|nr:hypothetical protein C8R43DRAFT_1149130 [Mycena crocata]
MRDELEVSSCGMSQNAAGMNSRRPVASPKGGSTGSSKINGVSSPKFGMGTSTSSPKFPPPANSRTVSVSRSSSRGRGGSRTPGESGVHGDGVGQQRSRSADAHSASGANINFYANGTANTSSSTTLTLLHPNASSAITLHPNASAILILHTLPSESPVHSPQSSDDGGECEDAENMGMEMQVGREEEEEEGVVPRRHGARCGQSWRGFCLVSLLFSEVFCVDFRFGSSKRISFAELPESWALSRPAGSSSGYRSSKAKSKSKAESKSKVGQG